MKLIIAGSRHFEFAYYEIAGALEFFNLGQKVKELISGGATGVDASVPFFIRTDLRLDYPYFNDVPAFKEFPADWKTHGNAAGPIRNKQMAEYADALLLIWDGESRGSKNMKETMLKLGKPVYEVIIKSYNTEAKDKEAGGEET